MLKLENITKKYGSTVAIDNLSLEIRKGELVGLVGESGCGKSTLAKVIVGLEKADSGNVSYLGEHPIQMVFQDPYSSINPGKKIGWLLDEALYLSDKKMSKEERKKRVSEILTECGLDESFISRYSASLSGGQRQRVAIALALVTGSDLIVADEPVSALDVSVQAQILNLFSSLREKHHFTSLFISHDLSVISYLCDRIAVMYLGYIVEVGSVEEISNKAFHPYTAALFAASESIETTLEGEADSSEVFGSGCPFAPRCVYAKERCKREKPELRGRNGHLFACHYPLGEER